MKIVRYKDETGVKLGAVKGDGVIDLTRRFPSLSDNAIELIEQWSEAKPQIEKIVSESAPDAALAKVRLLAPVARPGKIMAIGLNYADHIKETGQKMPPHQIWFTKAVTSINGPFDPIELPIASAQVDYEAELVVIVGKRCKHVSVRDWQMQTTQWVLGKSFDTHAPIGPWIVTTDEIGDPHTMGIRCFVNGERRQNSNTQNLVFNVYDQIAHLSRAMTLEPGDIIFTGTPGGVGLAMRPPQFLKAGDKVRVEIDRIGFIEAEMQAERASQAASSWR